MLLIEQVKRDIRSINKIRLPRWSVVLVGLGAAILSLLFAHFKRFDLVVPTVISVLALGFAITVKRNLRYYVWFWSTIATLAGVHVVLIVFVPWTSRWVPGVAIAFITTADVAVILAVVELVQNIIRK
jgi:hypothetical protein